MSNAAMMVGADTPGGASRALQGAALFVLLVVVAVRPLVSETYDSAGSALTRAVEGLADPSPARTLGFDLAILAATTLWAASFALEPRARYRRTGLEWGLALLAVGGVISCLAAGNKRLAINGTVDWISLPVLAITLAQLLRSQSHRRLVLAAIVASAAVNAAQCYDQYFVGFRETIAQYEAGKEAFWRKQGVDRDSTTVEAFERRLHAREASGFFAHSNVAGAYLVLAVFAAIALVRTRGWALLLGLLVIAMLGGAVFLTGSLGAMAGGAVGLGVWSLLYGKEDWVNRHRRGLFRAGWIAIILAAVAIIGHGLYHDALPGWSLTFRWQYWKASAAMIADHFVTGVGRENFGRNYTLYKDIASPEEVANPHNVLVQAMAEWGVLGLFALILMLIGVTRKAASRPIECNVADREESRIHEPAWAAALGLAVIALRSMLLGSADANYIYYSAVTTAMVWLPVFLIFTRLGARSLAPAALVAGLAAFLAQDAISFAFFTPAAAVTFFAVLGVWLSGRSSQEMPGPSFLHTPRWALPVALAAVTLLVAATLIAPVVRARSGLRQADQHTRDGRFSEADLVFARAQRADPLDSTPWLEHARALVERATVPSLETAVARLHEAKRRDPRLIIIHRNESLIRSALATMTGRPEHYHGAIDAARSALALYPQDPQGLVRLADTQATAGRALGDEELLRIAAEHYRQALSLDEKRLEWETIQRFRPRVVEEIRSKIAEIEAWRTR